MKRDMELCRKILFEIEKNDTDSEIMNLQIEGYTKAEIAYNCKLLYDGNLIFSYSEYIDDSFEVGQLTWEGSEFLDKIREDTVWNKTKEVIAKQGVPLAFEIIKKVAPTVIASIIGI